MKKIILTIIIIAIIIVISAFVYVMATQNEEKGLSNKSEEQIAYLENKVIMMMNHLNQIRFSNSVVVQQNIDNKESSKQNQESSGSSESSSSSGSEQGGESGGSSQQGESSSQGGSSQKSGNSENKEQTTSSEDNIQFAVKNNSILTNDKSEIDWDYIKTNTEIIYSTWPSMIVDLHELNVKNEDILNFSSTLDQVTLSAKQEDKTVMLNNLASLYALLPNYRSQISKDMQEINIDYTKSCVLNAYAFVEQDKWDEVKKQIQNAISYFSNIMNSINSNEQKQSQISKIYVSLNELNNTIDKKDKELFYIKYRNSMEELVHF